MMVKKFISVLLTGILVFQSAGAAFEDLPSDEQQYPSAITLVGRNVFGVTDEEVFDLNL